MNGTSTPASGSGRGLGGPATCLGWRRPRSSPERSSSTTATFAALAHNLSVAEADKMVWRPDVFGSVLFLVSSAYAIAALGSGPLRPRLRDLPWSIAWLNMLGSVAFMASAIASYVLPSTDAMIDVPLSNAGTLLGAVCFLVGAALMLPAWRAEVRSSSGHPAK
jgi:hypothetical protein